MNRPGTNKKKRFLPTLLGWGVLFIIVFMVRHFLVQSYQISTSSMQEALYPGDFVLVNKFHTSQNPGRNRPVLFKSPLLQDSLKPPLLVSRCIGMPGDTIRITDEGYYVNNQLFPRSPQALSRYSFAIELNRLFGEIMPLLSIPQRHRTEDSTKVYLDLTSFEEYQLREELTTSQNDLFQRQPVAEYSLIVPKKDRAFRLDNSSLKICREAILRETNEKAIFEEDHLILEGRETHFFFFSQDYFWLLSDHPAEAIDSRYLGIIPADHIIGNVWFCWYSHASGHWPKKVY